MKESLIDIVRILDSCAKDRKGRGIAPIARVHCLYNGDETNFWFTNSIVNPGTIRDLSKYGLFVPKRSAVAIKMQSNEIGSSFEYQQMTKIKRLKTYHVELENRSNLQDQSIEIAGDELLYQYRSIHDFLNALQENLSDIKEVESQIIDLNNQKKELGNKKETAHQRGQITNSIKELTKQYRILTQQQEDLKNITIYIRKQGEMRYSLIVDPIQTRIQSKNIFDGTTVIINGGPGTGKTTTMIHRLAYLTDIFAIDEDEKNKTNLFKLNSVQRKNLKDAILSQRDWLFFSPSKMLREYLAEAMKKEGLENTNRKVWNWKDYCRIVLENNYHLLGENYAFQNCHLTEPLFFQKSGVIKEFNEFYLSELRQIKTLLPAPNAEGAIYKWKSIELSISKRFNESDDFNLAQFVQLFNSLESLYGEECKSIIRENKAAINAVTDEILAVVEQNAEVKTILNDLFSLQLEYEQDEDIAEDDDIQEVNSANPLSDKLNKWLKAYSYKCVKDDAPFSDEYQMTKDILVQLFDDKLHAKIKKIGDLIVFEQFAKYTRGVKANMLDAMPNRYKRFRTYLSKSKFSGCNLMLLRDLMQKRSGIGLHFQEQALLLGFINNLVKQVKASGNKNIKHTFINAYDEVARPIIGIDEATDFSDCEIYAMESLLMRDFNSLTLCGDMMQRMTSYGITSWTDINEIVSNPMEVKLKTSYRQSKRVLKVASQIYEDTLGEAPIYRPFMKSNKVPDPLLYINESESSKIDWISKRISEVYRAYGEQLPSIAIFVNDKGYIPDFIDSIKKTEFFKTKVIDVYDGTDETSKTSDNHICVYPIDVVKGMEFDVVFFHNLDNSCVDTDLLKRYIYVGVSRAAFFLAVTLSEKNKELSKYFVQNKDWFKI